MFCADRDAEDGVHGVCRAAVLPGRQVSGNARHRRTGDLTWEGGVSCCCRQTSSNLVLVHGTRTHLMLKPVCPVATRLDGQGIVGEVGGGATALVSGEDRHAAGSCSGRHLWLCCLAEGHLCHVPASVLLPAHVPIGGEPGFEPAPCGSRSTVRVNLGKRNAFISSTSLTWVSIQPEDPLR